jgi:hypothetical protein
MWIPALATQISIAGKLATRIAASMGLDTIKAAPPMGKEHMGFHDRVLYSFTHRSNRFVTKSLLASCTLGSIWRDDHFDDA